MITSKIIGLITKERNISNLGNMGLAYYYDGHIYYNKWEEGIFKVNKFSEEKLTDETAYSINIVDDVIYYISVSKDQEILLKSIDIPLDSATSNILTKRTIGLLNSISCVVK